MSSADRLEEQARALAACTARLRRILADLGEAAPPWLSVSIDAHLTACAVAAHDLTRAAHHLRALDEPPLSGG
ncbi:hypothetical protein ACIBG7_35545 [Nonomuraea sp. NPDC050328]|uniref:hypothetical protein n=1 Tax=Nonomuraea sp. NPDC050328 TaxID=3364361 RepID=UPI0037B02267